MFQDFAVASVLLVLAQILRSRIKVLQKFLIPTPLLAGLMGLLGGPYCLNLLPFHLDESGNTGIANYPFELVAVLFATLFLGNRPRSAKGWGGLRNVGDTFFFSLAAPFGQYGIALLFGGLILRWIFSGIPDGLALMMPAGFAGGHGTATVVAATFQQHGWEGAQSIGYAFATFGLAIGVVGGLILINIGVRRGWTEFASTAPHASHGFCSGFVDPEKQACIGRATVSPLAIEPLAWHLSLALTAFGMAQWFSYFIQNTLPNCGLLPLFALAMLAGALLQFLLDLIHVGQYVDRQLMARIGSGSSDYLITFGVASIQPQLVAEHVVPVILLVLLGTGYSVAVILLLGPRIFQDHWFERSLFLFGWLTGVVAVGILLLRSVDPEMRSRTLDDYGVAYLGIALFDILLLIVLPVLVVNQYGMSAGIFLILTAGVCIFLSRHFVGWNSAVER